MFDPDELEAEPVEPAQPEATPLDGRGLAAVMHKAWKRLEARSRGEERCLPVPWPALANIYDDHEPRAVLRPGVHVLVGGTGSGKTQLALALALEAAHDGHPVSYVGLELDTPGIGARLAALEWARIRRTKGTGPQPVERWSVLDWPRTEAGYDALQRVRDEVADELDKLDGFRVSFAGARQGFSADDFGRLCHAVRERSSRERPGLVVLDFLQLLAPGVMVSADGKEERINPDDREIRTRIARASYVASDATRDGNLAVLLVSATARENYSKLTFDDPPPVESMVGLGKESGEIEYAATSVLVIARPGEDPGGMGGLRLVGVAKNRHGRTDWAWLGWNGSDFHDAPDERVDQAKQAAEKRKAEDASRAASTLARHGGKGKPKVNGKVAPPDDGAM